MNQPTPTPNADRPDGIAGLTKMSTTAGLGHEYRAVSAVAVTALSSAVLGLLALVVDALLILPLIALVLGVVAVVRIKQSGGTQTGLGISVGAIVLAGVVLAVGGSSVLGRISTERSDTAAINELVTQLRSALIEDDYVTAYAVTSGRFRDRFPLDFWQAAFDGMQSSFGNLTDVQTTGLIVFPGEEGGVRYAQTQLVFTVDGRSEPLRHVATFTRAADGPWELFTLAGVFE